MTASIRLSWREGVTAEAHGGGEFRVEGPGARVTLTQLAAANASALQRLAPPGDDEGKLADSVLEEGGAGALTRWYFGLQRLASRGLVVRSVDEEGRRLATLVPVAPAFRIAPMTIAPGRPVLLSRFAYLRREGETLVLESPRAHARVVLDDPRSVALIGALATPATARDVEGRASGLTAEAAALLLDLLAGAGMLQGVGPDGDDEPPALRSWEFHDLLFHARSRKGRSDAPFGATFRPEVALEPPPAFKPADDDDDGRFELFRPDLEQIERDDPPLARVLEMRRSLREYGDRPVTARQLGEFLYRVARAKGHREIETETPRGPVTIGFAPRPYPAGGALYELEFYVAVNNCDGLDLGLYHYDPQHHRLGLVRGWSTDLGHLLKDAADSAGIPAERVQLLVILSARFPRLAWKYASIAYALTLKHVGVVYQTMYLAATAMRLAPCALGGGDSDLFARLAGTDYYEETSVGEFLLGSQGPPDETDGH